MVGSDFTAASQEFWSARSDGGHRFSTEEWLAKYADEVLINIPSNGGILLDVGCGSCQLTTYLAPRFDKVYAVDNSKTMLETARRRVDASGLRNVETLEGSMQALPSGIHIVSVVLSYGVLQYLTLDDLAAHLTECRRVLPSNGIVLIANIPNMARRNWYRKTIMVPLQGGRLGPLRQWLAVKRKRFKAYAARDIFWDGVGNWFDRDDISSVAKQVGFSPEFVDSLYYEYRFHARLRLAA